jgi:hypothetical protein
MEHLLSLREVLGKLRDHTLRAINRNKYGGDKMKLYYGMTHQLERLGSHFVELGEQIHAKRIKNKQLYNLLVKRFDEISKCYLKNEFKSTERLWKTQYKEEEGLHEGKLNEIAAKEPLMAAYYLAIMKVYNQLCSRLLGLSS